eukprot:jgi/Tetstr1/421821/TSEL_012722.t1
MRSPDPPGGPAVPRQGDADAKQRREELIAQGISLDESIEKCGFGAFHWVAFLFVAVAGFPPTKEMVTMSFLGPALVCSWNLMPEQEATVQFAVFLGALLSSPVMGFLSDVVGRRPVIQLTLFLSSVPALLCAVAPDYRTLVGLRFLTGAGAACDPVLFTYFLELLPEAHRGKQVVALTLVWMTSMVFEAGLARATLTDFGWRTFLLGSGVPALIAWFMSWFMLESPHFLLVKGKTERAKDAMSTIAWMNRVDIPRAAMRFEYADSDEEEESSKGGEGVRGGCFHTWVGGPCYEVYGVMGNLLKPGMAKTTVLIMVFTFAVSFGTITLVDYTVKIYSEQSARQMQMCTPSGNILYTMYEYESMMLASASGMMGVLVAFLIVDCLGRKWTLFWMVLASAAFTSGMLFTMRDVSITNLLITGARTAIHGAYPVVGIYIGELYPTKFRATGESMAETFNSMAYMLGPYVVDVMYARGQMVTSVLIMVGVMLLGALATLACPREVSGQSLSQGTIKGSFHAKHPPAPDEEAPTRAGAGALLGLPVSPPLFCGG